MGSGARSSTGLLEKARPGSPLAISVAEGAPPVVAQTCRGRGGDEVGL
jgi:hypothetical protein